MTDPTLLHRYLDACAADVPHWMSRVAHDTLQALHAPTTRSSLRELPVRPRDEAENALRQHHVLWARRVGELLPERWRAELAGPPVDAGGARPRPGWSADSLTLVDEAVAEENIELLRVVQQVDHAVESALHELQARSATLRGDAAVRKNSNLLRPEAMVRAVWDASEVLGLAPPARRVLLRACGEPLARALRRVVDEAVARLASWGVAPAAWQASAMPAARRVAPPDSGRDLTRPGALEDLRSRLGTRSGADLVTRAGRLDAAGALDQLDVNIVRALAIPAVAGQMRLQPVLPYLEAAARHDDDREIMLLVGHLYDAVLDDTLVPGPVREVVAALQGPLLRMALREPLLLDDYGRPLWQLMIRLASHAVGFQDDDDPRLCRVLDEARHLFTRLQTAPPSTALHAQALQALDDLLRGDLDRERRDAAAPLARLRSAAHRAAVVEALRRQVRLELHEASSPWRVEGTGTSAPGATVDDELQRFLTGPWADALAHAVLNDGEQAETTRALLAVVPELLATLAPPRSDDTRRKLVATVPSIIQRLQQGMARIALPQAERDAVLALLMARHAELLRGPGTSAAAAASDAAEIVRRLREEEHDVADAPALPAAGDSLFDVATLDTVPAALMAESTGPGARDWLQSLQPGTWCRLVARGDWTVARVLWVDEARQHWLFSDAELGVTHGLTRRALERLGASGLAAPLESRNLVERAVDRLLAPRRP